MLNINISTPSSMITELKQKFKQKRLELNLTQKGLSSRSGVTLGSLKRFETSGQISLESLLKLASVLECLDDFKDIANLKDEMFGSIDEVLRSKEKPVKKRGSIK